MRAADLRIGNLVKYDNRIFAINTISKEFPTLDTNEFGEGVVGWPDVKGVPITPELLERFRCEKIFEGQYWITTKNFSIHIVFTSNKGCYFILKQTTDEEPNMQFIILNEANYIHELQNIYFALTREELKIK